MCYTFMPDMNSFISFVPSPTNLEADLRSQDLGSPTTLEADLGNQDEVFYKVFYYSLKLF